MRQRSYYVYILASKSRRLYIGVTNDLERRLYEHKNKLADGFTKRYSIDRLVYYEEGSDILSAIEREKQLKGWLRVKKIALIESVKSRLGRSERRTAKSRFFALLRMTDLGGCATNLGGRATRLGGRATKLGVCIPDSRGCAAQN
jgi:putative endonuclease